MKLEEFVRRGNFAQKAVDEVLRKPMKPRRRRSPPPERLDEPLRWLRANKHDLGALTGTDTRALLAIARCWPLYAAGGDRERHAAIAAVAHLLQAMQPKCWRFAKALIPWALDWDDEDPVWAKVKEQIDFAEVQS